MVRALIVAIVAGMCLGPAYAGAAPAGATPCSVTPGAAVMLRSSDFDPDVLVWDSRQRAIDYVSGNIKSTSEVLIHTVLSKPGTKALVVACDPGSSKPRYATAAEDTLGIKITTGPNKGRYGWVSSGDAHGAGPAQMATP